MGQYHYLINLDKKQFVHPHAIGNGLKLHEQVGWRYATATALVMLLAASSQNGGRGGGDFRASHPLVGAWAGDRIAFVGDYAESADIPGCDAKVIYDECNDGKSNWTNISAGVRELMSAEFGIRYQGDGWLDIVDERQKPASPQLCPDFILTNQPLTNPSLN